MFSSIPLTNSKLVFDYVLCLLEAHLKKFNIKTLLNSECEIVCCKIVSLIFDFNLNALNN